MMPTGQYDFNPSPQKSNGGYYYYGGARTEYSSRNGWRLPPFHKLDLNFTHSFSWFGLPWQVSINVYNAYNNHNVFSEWVQQDYNGYYSGEHSAPFVIHQVSLFPIIPTFGLSCKF